MRVPSQNLPPLIGRYEVVDRLGHGGMGVVYLARDPRIGRSVAIKLLRFSDDGLRERFLQEAQAAGNLKHRNIVTIYDYGEHDEQPFIVMEFIEGVTLAESIRGNHPMPLPRKLQLIEELALGLDYAHNKGIIHRDIKPTNLMVDRDGVLKILDFGIARVGDSSLTQSGMMMGTLSYMSPEQVNGRQVDRRSDIFAVGLVFYELVSYRQAFAREGTHPVMQAILHEAPDPLRQWCPDLDAGIEDIIDRALQKEPARRYQTLSGMAADIANVRQRLRAADHASLDESTVVRAPSPAIAGVRRTPRQGSDRELISKRRQERIDSHVQSARDAFDAGDYAAAAEACDQALLLDPDETRVLDLLDRARTALDDERVRQWLADARTALDGGDETWASQLIVQVLQIDPSSKPAMDLRVEIDEHASRRRQAREREALIASLLERSRAQLANGDPESAIRTASEILGHDPTSRAAHELTRQAMAEIEERRQREARDQAARAAIDQQSTAFAAGRWQEAIDALAAFIPRHEAVTAELIRMRADLAEIERQRHADEERRLREEAEAAQRRIAEQQWVERQLALARRALSEHRFEDAIELLQHVERVDASATGLEQLGQDARVGLAAREAEAQRRREVTEALGRATLEMTAGRLADARGIVQSVLAGTADHPEALALDRRIEVAIEARGRQEQHDRAARDAVETARRQFDGGEHIAAIAALESFAPPHALVTAALTSLRTEVDAREAEARQAERQRQEAEAHDRRARLVVDDAERVFASGDMTSALAALDAFAPPHATVSEARARLEAERFAVEERAQLAREEHERLERAEFLRREAEARRVAREQWYASELATARSLLARDQPSHAEQILERLRAALGKGDPDETRQEVDDQLLAARERLRFQALLADVRSDLKRRALPSAVERLDQARAMDGDAPEVLQLQREAEGLRDVLAQEEVDAEERRRQADEVRLARDREQQIAVALKRAKKSRSPREAISILNEALLLDATHRGCLELLAKREAESRSRPARAEPQSDPTIIAHGPASKPASPRTAMLAAGIAVLVVVSSWGLLRWRHASSLVAPPSADGAAVRVGDANSPTATQPGSGEIQPRTGVTAPTAPSPTNGNPSVTGAGPERAALGTKGSVASRGLPALTGIIPPRTPSTPPEGRADAAATRGTTTGGESRGVLGALGSGSASGVGRAGGISPDEQRSGEVSRIDGTGEPGGARNGAQGNTITTTSSGDAGSGGSGSRGTPGGANTLGSESTSTGAGRIGGAGPGASGDQTTNQLNRPAQEEAAVRQVLAQYEAAFNQRDIGTLSRLAPRMAAPRFDDYKSLRLALSVGLISVSNDTATAVCVRRVDGVATRGSTPVHDSRSSTFTLRRAGAFWLVESVIFN